MSAAQSLRDGRASSRSEITALRHSLTPPRASGSDQGRVERSFESEHGRTCGATDGVRSFTPTALRSTAALRVTGLFSAGCVRESGAHRCSGFRHRVLLELCRLHPFLEEMEHSRDATSRDDSRVGHLIESRLSSLERRQVFPASDRTAGVRLQALRIGWRRRFDDPRLRRVGSFSMAVKSRGLSRIDGGRRA